MRRAGQVAVRASGPGAGAQQREALAFVTEHLFSDKFFGLSPELLNHLASARWWHDGAYVDFILQENKKWGEIVKAAGIQPE